jgi:Legionella pneumophila major outer membrane protein precursor
MKCAKFLPFAALCLGLAMSAARARATEPATDYDLEPLLRRYGGETDQTFSSDQDDNTPPETLQPIVRHPSAIARLSHSTDPVSPASYTSPDDASSQLDQPSDPTQPRPAPQTIHALSRGTNVIQINTLNRSVQQGGVNSSAMDASDTGNDNPTPTPPPGPGSLSRAIQAQRAQAHGAANTMASFYDGSGGNSMSNSAGAEAPHPAPEMVNPGSESCNSGDCSSCMNDCDSCFSPCGCCGWYAGAEYLLVRPSFSQDTAYIQNTGTSPPGGPTVTTSTVVHQDFDYQSSVRAFLGYRFCDCGGEIRFTYWNYQNNGALQTAAVPDDGSVTYGGQNMVRADQPGQVLTVNNGLSMNVYDIDYSKCLCYGGCNSCGCNSCGGNSCGCGCNCCPVWTLKYSVGVRIADVNRFDNNSVSPPDLVSLPPDASFITASFIGAGPRVGLEGRRFFRGNQASLYAKCNFSLLLGEYDITETADTPDFTGALASVQRFVDDHDRMIPVAEIELGGDWQIRDCLHISAGYLFQAWWDLGAFEEPHYTNFNFPVDDSNIMAFDGLFARIEYCF